MLNFKRYFSGCNLTKRQRRELRKEVYRLTDYFEHVKEIPMQVAYIYEEGQFGVKKNLSRHRKFLKVSAELGSALGQEAYGLFLQENGEHQEALFWLENCDIRI